MTKSHTHRYWIWRISTILIALVNLAFSGGSPVLSISPSTSEDNLVYLPVIINHTADPIPDYLDQMDAAVLSEYTRELVETYGPRHHSFYRAFSNDRCDLGGDSYPNHNLIRASKYVFHVYEDLGIPAYKEWMPDWYGTYNVVVEKVGSDYPHVYIELGAHIDTVAETPGASDNAGGVAAVMEIARVLKDYPNRYSWRFIAFVGEEYQFVGSRYHIQQVEENNEAIKAGLIMDGIGWSELAHEQMNCSWDYDVPENRRISYLFESVRDQYNIDIAWRLCSVEAGFWSDNAAYWERGYAAVASVGGLPYTDPNLHECGDNMHAIDMQNVYLTAQENLAVLLKLDDEDYQPVSYQIEFPPGQTRLEGTPH